MLTIEDELFLRGVEVIRKRSMLTVAIVASVSILAVAFVAGYTVGFFRPPLTGGVELAQLKDTVFRMSVLLRLSLLLFLAIITASVVGVVVLISAYTRQTVQLLDMIGRLNAQAKEPTGG